MTHGSDDKALDRIRDSDEDAGEDSDKLDTVQSRLFGQTTIDKNDLREEDNLDQFAKADQDAKIQSLRRDIPPLEQNYDKPKPDLELTNHEECLKQPSKARDKILDNQRKGISLDEEVKLGKRDKREGEYDSIDEYQISDFMQNEWEQLAKISSKIM